MKIMCRWMLLGMAMPLLVCAAARPNVLLIISDDQGYGEFGFTGNKVVQTPHLDRLASQSAVFRNFIVAPACSPTRSTVLTGHNHLLGGVWGVGNRGYTRRDETLMPAFFQAAGYGTCFFGKRDSIMMMEMQAWDRGCDDAFLTWGGYVHHDPVIVSRGGETPMKGWTCDINTDQALDYIRKQGDKPWWAAVAFILPHLPWECDAKYSEMYRKKGCAPKLADFYGCVTQMDDAIGRLLDGLRDAGRERDTMVFFLSDNGPSYKEMTETDIASRNVAGLRGGKASAWDNGIRVPLLVRWPGRIPPGDRSQFGTAEDILPTMVDLAGISDSAQRLPHQPWDGISLKPALENPRAPEVDRTVLRLAISGEGSPYTGKTGVISDPMQLKLEDHHVVLRGPRFKFHALPGGSSALYDMTSDPGETTDVSAQYPEILASMAKACREEWTAITHSGRAFGIPPVMVDMQPGPGVNKVDAGMAREVRGRVRCLFDGTHGFAAAGDAAGFDIDVRAPGRFKVAAIGADVDQCGDLTLEMGSIKVPGRKKSSAIVEFGPVEFPAGPARIWLKVEGTPAANAKPVLIKNIGFYPSPVVKRTEKGDHANNHEKNNSVPPGV